MSFIETGEEVKFARSLVNPDKALRDQTLQSLQKYASALQNIEDLEMLKLWKGLYYCMWLSDKQDIQFELATSLANLIDKFRSQTIVFQYIRMFYRTILREWYSLDQYRVNKFYTLIRLFLNRSLNYAYKSKWSSDVTSAVLSILNEEVLTKKPNGIRFHIADIFVHELWSVTEGSISVKHFMTLLQPFIDVFVVGSNDSVFIERVQQAVFLKFLDENAGQNEKEDGEADSTAKLFSNDITLGIQKQLFELASEESTSESARKRLYALHKSYAAKSGIPFVSEDDIKNAKKSTGKPVSRPVEGLKVSQTVSDEVVPESKQKSSKKKRSNSEVDSAVSSAVVEEAITTSKSKKSKVVPTTESEKQPQEAKPVSTEKKIKSSDVASIKSKEEAPVTTKDGKKAAEPAEESVKGKKLKSILTAAPEPTPAAEAEFIASKKFAGAKPGYVFHNVSDCLLELFLIDLMVIVG